MCNAFTTWGRPEPIARAHNGDTHTGIAAAAVTPRSERSSHLALDDVGEEQVGLVALKLVGVHLLDPDHDVRFAQVLRHHRAGGLILHAKAKGGVVGGSPLCVVGGLMLVGGRWLVVGGWLMVGKIGKGRGTSSSGKARRLDGWKNTGIPCSLISLAT